MRALLLRHGVTGETGKVLTGRLPGVSLSDKGRIDARIAADRLSFETIAAVYSSPIRRCRETARIVASAHDLTPITDQRFIEADYGAWSGRRLKDLYRLKAWERLMAHASRFRFPDGETLAEVQARAVAGLEALAARHGSETVAVVSHSDVIRALVCHYLGAPLDLIHRTHVSPTSLSVIDLGPDGSVHVPVVNQSLEPLGAAS
jgi:probable phosphomutase (TIGR03848 family)